MENNPNMIDSLFTPDFCVLHISRIGVMVREQRKLFLHKGSWHKFKGYAYSNMHKANFKSHKGLEEILSFENDNNIPHKTSLTDIDNEIKNRCNNVNLISLSDEQLIKYKELYHEMNKHSSRAENIKFTSGTDRKFLYHIVRLISEVEQILIEGDLDLQRNREHMKAVRRGEVSHEDVKKWFSEKEKSLEKLYAESKLRHSPDEEAIKQLLLNCLEEHYGSLQDAIVNPDRAVVALRQIQEIIENNKSLL